MTEAELFAKAVLIRMAEERLLALYQNGDIHGTIHTCIGQEFAAVTVAGQLRPGDAVLSNHRGHGHYLAFTDDVNGLFDEIRSGVGGSQHLCRDGFYSSGIQGGLAPVSLGLSLARRLRDTQEIAVLFIGDGTLGEGALYESLNIAAKWELPLLVVVENNQIAQSTPMGDAIAGSIESRAEAFGLPWNRGNTWDWKSLTKEAANAVLKVREERKPRVLIVDTYRLRAHSKGDDTRAPTEVEAFALKDPLNQWLAKPGPEGTALIEKIRVRLDQAVQRPAAARNERRSTASKTISWRAAEKNPPGRIGKLLNQAFHQILKENPRALFIGQDVLSPYGGAFKIADQLSEKFPAQVRATPVSESAIAGLATGLALDGFRPFAEFMFGDFTLLAFDQIVNHAAKMSAMYGRPLDLPAVFRAPMGGRRGYGPTHSQSLEKHFFGVPGLQVAALNTFVEPGRIYHHLARHANSAWLVAENKELYTLDLYADVPGFTLKLSDESLPTAVLLPQNPEVALTLIGYGGMSPYLVEAAQILFEQHDVICQILCPSQIYPLDVTKFGSVLLNAPNVFVVEEGQSFSGFGAEILAQLAGDPHLRSLRTGRLAALAQMIPANIKAEAEVLPSVSSIVQGCLALISETI